MKYINKLAKENMTVDNSNAVDKIFVNICRMFDLVVLLLWERQDIVSVVGPITVRRRRSTEQNSPAITRYSDAIAYQRPTAAAVYSSDSSLGATLTISA